MKSVVRVAWAITLSLCFGIAVSACSSNSSGTRTGPAESWFSAQTPTAARVARASGENLVPDSVTLSGWRISDTANRGSVGNFVLVSRGVHGGAGYTLTGSGAPPAKEIYSPAIPVKPGQTYAFSAWVDGSKITRGWTYLWISSAKRDRIYATAKIPPGQAGRYGFSARIPSDVGEIVFGYYTAGCSLPKGAKLAFSQPAITASRQ